MADQNNGPGFEENINNQRKVLPKVVEMPSNKPPNASQSYVTVHKSSAGAEDMTYNHLEFQKKLNSKKSNVLIYIPKKTDTVWKTLANTLPGEDFVERILKFHELMVRGNILLAGFSFVAFKEEPVALARLENQTWRKIYGFVGVMGFTCACLATIFSLILFAMLSILGPEGARFFGGMDMDIDYSHFSYWS